MSLLPINQHSFFHPEFAAPDCLEEGTVPWLLARYRSALFPAWIFKGWVGGHRRGRPAWPAAVLMTLLLLRWQEKGISRLASTREAKRNIEWLAAMGLEIGARTPSEKRLRKFERFLRARHPDADMPRYQVFHEHVVRLCLADGHIMRNAVWAMDSTPMWCFGAVLDTVRLLGDGVRQLGRKWAELTDTTVEALAAEWELPLLVARSTKGSYRIDWRDRDARSTVINDLATKVLRAVEIIRPQVGSVRFNKRKWVLRRCQHLLSVIGNDLETDKQGRLQVAKRVARNRLISLTDPQARHGRKSRTGTFNGFKLHLLGDIVSGLIASIAVTRGNEHDSRVAHPLVRRAKELCGFIGLVLADTAYGSAALRHVLKKIDGVDLFAPPPPVTSVRKGMLSRSDIAIDFDTSTATCAAGITTSLASFIWSREYGAAVPCYRWPAATCNPCALRACCRGKQRGGHRVLLHPFERELRAARQLWQIPDVREAYRARSQCERLVNEMTRHGGRKVGAPGLGYARQQAHLIATRCNLALLARQLAQSDSTASVVDA